MSMAHSVEARTPLCDNQLVDFALRIPLKIKLWDNTLKSLTKNAMKRLLPEVLYSLPKRGFPTPFARWYRTEPLTSFIRALLFDAKTRERGIINSRYLKKLFDKNMVSRSDSLYDYERANELYSASMIELWFRTFIDQDSPRAVS